jgi:hypothetical protein
VAFGIALVGFCWLAWQIAINALASSRAESDPEGALTWWPNLPTALVALAEQKLIAAKTPRDLTGAGDLARRALRASPLEQPAVRLLGLVADINGDTQAADGLMELAGKRSLHDAVAQVWLFGQRARSGDLDSALAAADALLRTRSDLGGQLMPVLANMAKDDSFRTALIALLGRDPSWRGWLLGEMPRATEPSVAYAILVGLESGPTPPRNSEIAPFLDQLISVGNFELAYLAWMHFLPDDQAEKLGFLYGGDFSRPPSGLAFDWVIASVPGAHTEVVATGEESRGAALRVTFSNTRVAYRHTSKLLLLRPGTYAFGGVVRADNLVNERGMTWRISCAEGDHEALAETARVAGTTSWQAFTEDFTVPPTGCRAQWLRLELAARVAVEQQVSGEIWYDDLAIARHADTITPPPG